MGRASAWATVLSVVVVVGSMATARADGVRGDQPPVTIGDKDGYPQITGKNQAGAGCAPRSGSIGGGLIVSLGGQHAAALTGAGVGCASFYDLEVGGGPPKVEEPDVEPAVSVDPGRPVVLPSAAEAIHLFPLVPGDPGGDCAQKLSPSVGRSAGEVGVGYVSFDDHPRGFLGADGTGPLVSIAFPATTTIKVGESVTWRWEVPYCHSIQSEDVPAGAKPFSTNGGAGSATGLAKGEDSLVRPNGPDDSFTVTFTVPGTYDYSCVHHRSIGMVGKVIVTG